LKILHLITARKGSKGLPGKNTKELLGKPLFLYSVDFALKNMSKQDELCISTNDKELINIAKKNGVKVHFIRPDKLASDSATSQDVILHAIHFFEKKGQCFDAVMLLQPTSPYRSNIDYSNVMEAFSNHVDMIVSVKESKENPYFTLVEEDKNGFLTKSKKGQFTRRQDCPSVYAYNGSIYLIRSSVLKKKLLSDLSAVKKVLMPAERSVDIDTIADWVLAEYYFKQGKNS
jgi:N-acylneuraminate cytidylyltransferase